MFQDFAVDFRIEYDGSERAERDVVLAYDGKTALCSVSDGELRLPRICDFDRTISAVHAFRAGGERFLLSLGEKPEAEGFEYQDIDRIKTVSPGLRQFAAVTGYHYYRFHMENRFCGKCGGKTVHRPEKRCMICTRCGNEIFPKISPAVVVGVTDDRTDSIILTKYAGGSYRKYALVAGFAEMGETAEQAARREVMEETGIEITELKYFGSQPWGFSQNMLIGFFAKAKGSRRIVMDQEELSEAKWVRRDELEAKENSISLTNEMIWAFKCGKV
ncbi:NAD(+) diphosphatase [Ruminococcus sp. Marseille-P6503]|uniref:NAD(+) diphosphatase n=1 Tax=Ruminococcus sp. Marseille-P6503 TaxID=2364796 RepID=UPI000F526038|nr:NAD(+) diphosphatase [Ruminococcus sp. Marseille-P6503]